MTMRGDGTLNIEGLIRDYLIGHGIKQAFIADRCDWTRQKTSAILTGKKKITAEEYGSICEVIGVPYDYFYDAVAQKPQNTPTPVA